MIPETATRVPGHVARNSWIAGRRRSVILGLILLGSLTFNVIGLDWGLPYIWHTDEKWTQAVRIIQRRTADPNYFINPHLHIYALAAVMAPAYIVYPGNYFDFSLYKLIRYTNPAHPRRPFQRLAVRLGRGLSVAVSLLTVFFIYRLGRRDFDERAGLLGAAYLAVSMGFVNQAHFATLEATLFLLTVLALGAFSRLVCDSARRHYVMAGLWFGLACSTKYTAGLLLIPLLGAHLFGRGLRSGLSRRGIADLAFGGAVSIAAFFATTPYALIRWRDFWEHGVVFSYKTGTATGNLLAPVHFSWPVYFDLLGNIMGWPLFLIAIAGLGWATARAVNRILPREARAGAFVHALWIWSFYLILGISQHHALRFIMPIVPSLALLAGAVTVVAISSTAHVPRRAAIAGAAAVLLYSIVYTARSDAMMLRDTRYTAGRWLEIHCFPPNDMVDYFALDAYLPYFDRPKYQLRPVPLVQDRTRRAEPFDVRARRFLDNARNPIVDSEFYYNRFLDPNMRPFFPERVAFYERLLSGTDAGGYRVAQKFTYDNPWWLNPRPERIAPEVDVFAKPGMIVPCANDRRLVK